MLKGFLIVVSAVLFSATVPGLYAQVYKCDGPTGTVFSDMPCGDSAEEIEVEGMEPEPVVLEDAEIEEDSADVPDKEQSYRNFLGVLNSQKLFKIGEVDRELTSLRDTASSPGFEEMTDAERLTVTDQIADLERERETIVAEYDGLIAEMERRIETDEAIETAQGQLPQ